MIRNFFRKKGDNELNKKHDEHEAEIVDLAEETASQNDQQAGTEELLESPSAQPQSAGAASVEADLKNKLIRLQADFDNYRKRTATGRSEAREETRRELLLDLLPVYDNFQRALGHAQEQEDYGALRAGIQGIMQQMEEYFNRHNLKTIPAGPGTPFDPNKHDALGMAPGTEENAGTIAQEILKGYEINGYVIRPSQVLVFNAAAESE